MVFRLNDITTSFVRAIPVDMFDTDPSPGTSHDASTIGLLESLDAIMYHASKAFAYVVSACVGPALNEGLHDLAADTGLHRELVRLSRFGNRK